MTTPSAAPAETPTSHTKGPWQVDPEPEYQQPGNLPVYSVYETASDEEIARVWALPVTMAEGLANAHLIAAAPDLLASAILTVGNVLDVGYVTGPTIDKLRAAITRAEGRTNG